MNTIDSPKTTQRMQPIVAAKALRRLIADPEQTHEVFEVIRALSGPALKKGHRRFAQTDVGRTVLREKINLLDTLNNKEQLAALPANTLARHYLSFVTNEQITADGLVEASATEGFDSMEEDVARFGERQRDMHDLWHTLTQYGRDQLGEVCLLAFTYAQTKNRGVGAICLTGCAKLAQIYGGGVFKVAWGAYRAGKAAAWLPGQDWEALLRQPIADVRANLNIDPPTLYLALRGDGALAA